MESILGLDSIEQYSGHAYLYFLIPIGTIMTGIGLLLKKGWAWSFTILINSYLLLWGLLDVLRRYLTIEDAGDVKKIVFAIAINAIIHVPIYFYLLNKEVKKIYPPSSISLYAIGLFLMSFMMVDYPATLHGHLKILLFIISMAIVDSDVPIY